MTSSYLRKVRIPRSAGLTFALAYALIFVVSGAVFLGFVWFHAIQTMQKSHINAIAADTENLVEIWQRGGEPDLKDVINRRIAEDLDRDNVYLLVDRHSQILAGNISCWPTQATSPDRFYTLNRDDVCDATIFEMTWKRLPDGSRLLVGRDMRNSDLLKTVMTDGILWAAFMSLLLAIGGALVVRHLFRKIIVTIARTTDAITRGNLSQRLPLNGSELDSVSGTINTMLDRITRLMEGIRQVSNAIAHDLRTPITRARNTLEDSALHAETVDQLRSATEDAVRELDNVTAVFDALLRIAQLESGARRSAFEQRDLRQPLEDIADLYRATAETRDISLIEDLAPTLPFYGDALLIQQAMANLVDNAIKFSPDHTSITIGARLNAEAIKLFVQDQGIGMSTDDCDRASERFFRAETARHTPGTGLGLSLVSAIVQMHEGRLEILPQNRGLKIVMTLPRNASGTSS